MSGTLSVIVAQRNVDPAPIAAHLARNLGDGLAIRVVAADPTMLFGGNPIDYRHLPTAAIYPDVNLGVAGEWAPGPLGADIATAQDAGIQVAHRLTLHPRAGVDGSGVNSVETHDLHMHARDAVLRARGAVHIEAGNGQTALQALAAVGIPPYAEYVKYLDITLVVSADVPHLDDTWIDTIAVFLDANGGAHPGGNVAVYLAVVGIEEHLPVLRGLGAADLEAAIEDTLIGDEATDPRGGLRAAGRRLFSLSRAVHHRTGLDVEMWATGPSTIIDQ